MADMSDPYDVMQATVDHCQYEAERARTEAAAAIERANAWQAAANKAAQHLREFQEWTPRSAPAPTPEGNAR